MKKYAYAAQMNSVEVASVIKRHRNARKVSLSDHDEMSHVAKILSNLGNFKV